ncbi:MAG: RNA polymerase sigma factor [Planctomycetales bacterium]
MTDCERTPLVIEDATLVNRCLGGDPDALRAFVERYQGNVFGLCFRMLGHRQDAEDVAQDSLIRALRHLAGWDPARPIVPWLLGIAANRCRTWLAKRALRPPHRELLDELGDDQSLVDQLGLAEELHLALNQIREEYRLCFVLYHQNELSLTEISQIVGSPVGTVKTWLFRARRELARLLQHRGLAPRGTHELRSV